MKTDVKSLSLEDCQERVEQLEKKLSIEYSYTRNPRLYQNLSSLIAAAFSPIHIFTPSEEDPEFGTWSYANKYSLWQNFRRYLVDDGGLIDLWTSPEMRHAVRVLDHVIEALSWARGKNDEDLAKFRADDVTYIFLDPESIETSIEGVLLLQSVALKITPGEQSNFDKEEIDDLMLALKTVQYCQQVYSTAIK